jgi:hypothetical protein
VVVLVVRVDDNKGRVEQKSRKKTQGRRPAQSAGFPAAALRSAHRAAHSRRRTCRTYAPPSLLGRTPLGVGVGHYKGRAARTAGAPRHYCGSAVRGPLRAGSDAFEFQTILF